MQSALKKGITLYTVGTPNGYKPQMLLEELGIGYETMVLSFAKKEQKSDWFVNNVNPNGRIPAIVDHDADDFAVFESGAVLMYLAEKYGKFNGSNAKEKSQIQQWMFFQAGGTGPMQGQASHFLNYAPEDIPYAKSDTWMKPVVVSKFWIWV
jgi:GSH-dependent disulfide-bond oxidoreductase